MKYPHHWLCLRPDAATPGTQDPTTGALTGAGTLTVYDGKADCQDEGEETSRDAEGRLLIRSVSRLFLADTSKIGAHKAGDVGTVTWEDQTTDDAKVVSVRRLDSSLELEWL